MGGPPGVTNAAGCFHAPTCCTLSSRVLDAALGFDHPFSPSRRSTAIDRRSHTHGNQLIQSLAANGHGLFPAHISYDSAHKNFSQIKMNACGDVVTAVTPPFFSLSASRCGVNAQGASAEWFDPPPPRQLPAGSPGAFFFASALARPHHLSIAWAFAAPYPRQKPGIWV